MQSDSQTIPSARQKRRKWLVIAVAVLLSLAVGIWIWRSQADASKLKTKKVIPEQVVSAVVVQQDVPVMLTAKGTVSALQMVEVRPQISATVKAVHIKEGQFVRRGERLFTLDTRTEAANLSKAEAQLTKDRADLTNAERNLERQRELFRQKFISQAALDTAQNQVDGMRGQLAVNQAAVAASRVARSFGEITAPIDGRSGSISVYPGSLVQPSGAPLVNITQIDPINVTFTLPESELTALQTQMAQAAVPVSASLAGPGQADPQAISKGRLVFIDNAVDTASGTIRLKAEFQNDDKRLWPGMFVTVTLAPRVLVGALTVPAQAVQTGPEKKFVYVIGADRKVSIAPIKLRLIQDARAVIEGVAPGTRVVVEGAQNLRPGSVVTEAGSAGPEKNTQKKAGRAKVQSKPEAAP